MSRLSRSPGSLRGVSAVLFFRTRVGLGGLRRYVSMVRDFFRAALTLAAIGMFALSLSGCPNERGRFVLRPVPVSEDDTEDAAVCLRLVNARSGAAEVRLEHDGEGLAAAYGTSSERVCTVGALPFTVRDGVGAFLAEGTLPATGEMLVVVGDTPGPSAVRQIALDAAEGADAELQLVRASAPAAALRARLRDAGTASPALDSTATGGLEEASSEREVEAGWHVVSSQPALVLGEDFRFSLTLAARPERYVFVVLGDPERAPGRTGPDDAGLFGILLGPPQPTPTGSAGHEPGVLAPEASEALALTVLQDPLLYVVHGLVEGPALEVRAAQHALKDLEFGEVAGPWHLDAGSTELLIRSAERVFIDTRTPGAHPGERLVAVVSGSAEVNAYAAPELLVFNEGLSLAARDLSRSRVLHASKPAETDAFLLDTVDVMLGDGSLGPYFARIAFAEGSQPEDGLPTESAFPQPYRILSSESLESVGSGTLPALPQRALLLLLGSRALGTITPFGLYPVEVRANGTVVALRPEPILASRETTLD